MEIEIRAWAERLLFGDAVADKQWAPPRLTDRRPGAPISTPPSPGRPPELALRGPRSALPRRLLTDRDRGITLHAFANHELLALELLALALLRFPDAPTGLRRSWVATARDEQRHLAAYLERMSACGVALGEEGVSAFFWDALSDASGPAAFVAGLSLTLEQANLDFSRHAIDAFRGAGDDETAQVLEGVYDDEIRHVRAGVRWFARLDPGGAVRFDAWRDALTFPLTPARARGPVFDVEARRRAGLSAAFVDELRVTSVSRGRDPTLYLFDPSVEDAIAGRAPSGAPIRDDLACLPMILAHADDVVVAPRPSIGFLEGLANAGFVVPQFVPDAAPEHLPNGRAGALRPWGWSPAVAARLAPLGGRWDPAWALLSSKAWAVERLRDVLPACTVPTDAADVGVVCTSVEAVLAAVPERRSVAKAAYSSAGGHRLHLEGRVDDEGLAWLRRALVFGPVVVEPWLPVVAELSVQVEVAERIRVLGVTRFGAARGVFRGAIVGPPERGLPPELRRFVARARPDLERAGREVGAAAAALGYRGPLGVDALVLGDERGMRLKPISEVNPRFTMGRLALELSRVRRPTSVGAWLFLPVRALRRSGFAGPASFAARCSAVHPVVRDGARLVAGAVATNDPATARAVLTLLWLDHSEAAARERFRSFVDGLTDPEPLRRAAAFWTEPSAGYDPTRGT